jgi:glycosyltransferase involved in cell wall biosynthesis
VLEWLAAGRPVIASRRGGLAESADLPGVRAVEPTAAGLLEALDEPLNAPEPVAGNGARARWLDEHAELLRP